MRVLIVDTCYPAFLADHYAENPGLAEQPYEIQWGALMDTFFGTADSYSYYLEQLGHAAHEVVANCEPMQAAWLRKHGSTSSVLRANLMRHNILRQQELVLAQAKWFEPDVVYVQNIGWLLEPTLLRLRKHARMIVGQIASEAPAPRKLRRYDLILTSFPHYVDRFRALGVSAAYFRIGFDERVLDRLKQEGAPLATDGAVFVGALNRTQHRGGNALLAEASERTELAIWGYAVEGWPADSAVYRAYRGEAWGLDMYRRLRAARISLNRHIEVAEDNANNMRLYESTGVEAMLLTDEKQNLGELFEPGREVVTYGGVDDLVDKIAYYLEHEQERAAIAAAGQRRTLAEHTYRNRMEELSAILGEELSKRGHKRARISVSRR